ncbi:MAG: hypothetical protein KAJ46_01170 [Sedimentisphaerales bacterium]|nr:hypothetical protein [Sedimentisphaerales bacterium]
MNDLLTEQEKDVCRRVMKIRGDEMYRHLCPRHLRQPYSSHSNRAWHFLGEVGIAFLGEVEGGYALWVKLSDGEFTALLPTDDQAELTGFGLSSKGTIKVRLKRADLTEIIGLSRH